MISQRRGVSFMRGLTILVGFVLFLPTAATGQGAGSSPVAAKLVGAWEMIEEQEIDPQGNVTARDRDVTGMLVYTAAGRMAVQIMYKHGRPTVSTAGDDEATGLGMGHVRWGAEASQAAIDTYDAYFGTYVVDVERNRVTHQVVGELRPPGVGAKYERQFELHGDELWLRSPDPRQHWRIIWRRVQG
jgi:hypothetical protein